MGWDTQNEGPLSHELMNKDEPWSIQGKQVHKPTGATYFNYAKSTAIKASVEYLNKVRMAEKEQ